MGFGSCQNLVFAVGGKSAAFSLVQFGSNPIDFYLLFSGLSNEIIDKFTLAAVFFAVDLGF